MISKEKKAAIMAEYGRTPNDTGSPEVQIAILTARIQELTEHLKENPKDHENGWSETWYACLPSEKRSGRLSCTDRKIRHQKIITGQLSEQSGISALFWIGGRVYPRPLMCTKGDFYSSHAHFKIIRKTPFLGFFVALLLFLLMKQLSLYRSVVSGLLPQ